MRSMAKLVGIGTLRPEQPETAKTHDPEVGVPRAPTEAVIREACLPPRPLLLGRDFILPLPELDGGLSVSPFTCLAACP